MAKDRSCVDVKNVDFEEPLYFTLKRAVYMALFGTRNTHIHSSKQDVIPLSH